MNAAALLTLARRRSGFSQRELARRARAAQPTISRIERGVVSPTVDTLERLLAACGSELDVVYRPTGDVDRTLIVDRLALTPGQRARLAAAEWNGLAPFRRARRVS